MLEQVDSIAGLECLKREMEAAVVLGHGNVFGNARIINQMGLEA